MGCNRYIMRNEKTFSGVTNEKMLTKFLIYRLALLKGFVQTNCCEASAASEAAVHNQNLKEM